MNNKPKERETGFCVSKDWPLSPVLGHKKQRSVQNVVTEAKKKAVEEIVANHTLIVGQSRSGKTNAARRLIEEILLWTEARVVILDPNADFKWLQDVATSPSSEADDGQFKVMWDHLRKRIKVATPGGAAWGIDWNKLSMQEMAAFLQLEPAHTFAEYRHLDRHFKYQIETAENVGTLQEFLKSGYFNVAVGEELEKYRLRLDALSKLKVWATNATRDLDSLLRSNYRALVVDLSIDDEQVKMITVARTLEALWKDAEKKRGELLQKGTHPWSGTLLVIDESHVFAPPKTDDLQKRLVCERIQRYADQGKKLNLYIMAITQQPGKLHQDVLSEFNNRIIMRVNERQSLRVLEETYGGLQGRYDGALTFSRGQALIEGALLCDESPPPVVPRAIRFLMARTREGGGTPSTDWAIPKEVL